MIRFSESDCSGQIEFCKYQSMIPLNSIKQLSIASIRTMHVPTQYVASTVLAASTSAQSTKLYSYTQYIIIGHIFYYVENKFSAYIHHDQSIHLSSM